MGNPGPQTPPTHRRQDHRSDRRTPETIRYSVSREGFTSLGWPSWTGISRRYRVEFDPDTEAIATIGAKERAWPTCPGDAGAGRHRPGPQPHLPYPYVLGHDRRSDVHSVPIGPDRDFFEDLTRAKGGDTWPRPKMMILSFPTTPRRRTVDKSFFEKIVAIARENHILIVHDFAYAIFASTGTSPPACSRCRTRGTWAEMFSMSKSYNMPGWRWASW